MEVMYMPFPKSVKIAAIVSQSLVVLWGVLSLFSNIFQDNLLKWYVDSYMVENTDKIVSWSVVVRCIAALIVSGANVLICSRKTVHTPVVMVSVTAGLRPVFLSIQKPAVDNDSLFGWSRCSGTIECSAEH